VLHLHCYSITASLELILVGVAKTNVFCRQVWMKCMRHNSAALVENDSTTKLIYFYCGIFSLIV